MNITPEMTLFSPQVLPRPHPPTCGVFWLEDIHLSYLSQLPIIGYTFIFIEGGWYLKKDGWEEFSLKEGCRIPKPIQPYTGRIGIACWDCATVFETIDREKGVLWAEVDFDSHRLLWLPKKALVQKKNILILIENVCWLHYRFLIAKTFWK